jgi:hypothetical protein
MAISSEKISSAPRTRKLLSIVVSPEEETSKRRVRFTTVEIWEFSIILGDNPSVSDGPPISMSCKPWRRRKFSIEKYENIRKDRRRTRKQLKLSTKTRESKLRITGYTNEQIQLCSMRAAAHKKQKLSPVHQMLRLARERQQGYRYQVISA